MGGGGGTPIFLYIRRLGPFWSSFEYQSVLVFVFVFFFQKKCIFLGFEGIMDIFGGSS